MKSIDIKIFISHSFNSDLYDGGIDFFRRKIKDAIQKGIFNLQLSESIVNPIIYFQGNNFGASLPHQIRNEMQQCDFAIVDISNLTSNVVFELGYLMGLAKDVIILSKHDSNSKIPADIQDTLIGFYKSIDDELVESLSIQSATLILKILSSVKINNKTSKCEWFINHPEQIHIICAPEPEKSRFADLKDSNYLYIDNLDDRDALLQLCMYLSRSFPNSIIYRHSSDSVPPDILSQNLVIIGGPGDEEGGNTIASDFMNAMNLRVHYSEDCEKMIVNGKELSANFASNQKLLSDWGYFARFINPYNSNSVVILCQGIHTSGTLGSTLAFSDDIIGAENMRKVKMKYNSDKNELINFDAIFQVQVVAGNRILCPIVKNEHIESL